MFAWFSQIAVLAFQPVHTTSDLYYRTRFEKLEPRSVRIGDCVICIVEESPLIVRNRRSKIQAGATSSARIEHGQPGEAVSQEPAYRCAALLHRASAHGYPAWSDGNRSGDAGQQYGRT